MFRSRDHGDSWQRISPDLTTNDPEKYQLDRIDVLKKELGDASKARRQLGWEPTVALQAGLEKTIPYFAGIIKGA